MRAHAAVILGVIFAAASCAPIVATEVQTTDRPAAAEYVPGEVLVQFQPGTAEQRMDEIIRLVGAEKEEKLGIPFGYRLRFSTALPVKEMVRRLRAFDEVRLAEPNRIMRQLPEAK